MRVAAVLSKSFNVRSGEWRLLLLLYTMSVVVLTGCTWADAIVQGAFLQRVGVQYLPWVVISSATCSFIAMFIYTAFADRVSNTRLLIAILVISGAGMLLGLAALAIGLVGPAYLLLFLVLQVPLLDVYNVHWATYVNGFYDIRTAKRIVPVLSTAARIAGIIGGLSMPVMNRLLNPPGILAVCIASLAVMAFLAAAMPRLLHTERSGPGGWSGAQAVPQAASSPSYGTRLREGYEQIARSKFLRWMAISTLCMTILMTMFNYGASAIFQAELKTMVAISDFLGMLGGVANLVVLPFQMFVLSRLIARLGLGNASLIFPLTTLVSAGGLAVAPSMGTAALAHLDRTALRTAFRIPTDNLLYNAVPQRVKARTRAFVGGLVVPIGAIAGGLLLLSPLARTSWFLPAAMLVLGVAFAVVGLMVRRYYGPALLDLLEQEDYSSLALQAPSLQEPVAFATADTATLGRLSQKLNESTSPERVLFLAQLIAAVGGDAAVPIVAQAARSAPDGRLRAALVDVFVTADIRGAAVRELYLELLSDSDGQVRIAAIGGLEQADGPHDRRYLEMAARLLADPDVAVRLRVLPSLIGAANPGWHKAGSDELRALLGALDPHVRARALGLAGQAHAADFLPEVVASLTDDADAVRLAATLAAEMLAGSELPGDSREALRAALTPLLHDPIERVRMAAVTILGRFSSGSGQDAVAVRKRLFGVLTDPNRDVRERAVAVLAGAGENAIPQAQEQLSAGDPHLRTMAAVVLARIEPRRYASLVRGSVVNGSLLAVYRNLCCQQTLADCPGPAAAVLRRALREWNAALVNEIFSLLAATQDPGAIETVARSLRSPQPETRANATEALESLTAPQMAALVAPLFEPDLPPAALLALARQTWNIVTPTPAAAIRLLLTDTGDAWPRTLAAAALAEMDASADHTMEVEVTELVRLAEADSDVAVRTEVEIAGAGHQEGRQDRTLTLVQKLVCLQEAPFLQGMTVDQLKVLASVCEEVHFPAGSHLFKQGDAGGAFFLVVRGSVGIEQEKRKDAFVRLATVAAPSYVGETEFFDDSCRTSSAIALRDTQTLRLCRDPVIALARRQPDLAQELTNVLSARLRQANDRIADLTRTHPRELHKLFDQLT